MECKHANVNQQQKKCIVRPYQGATELYLSHKGDQYFKKSLSTIQLQVRDLLFHPNR